ncbi:MAG: hypothetical protein PHN75_05160 [Syntrophales bacterium]|nr:hypothetical protein [Syntrophales bacterium]
MFIKRTSRLDIFLLALTMMAVGACASMPEGKNPSATRPATVSYPSDNALFQEGIALLGTSYTNAREAFDKLVRVYPNSKWRPSAEALVRLLDDLNEAKSRAMVERREIRNLQGGTQEMQRLLDQSKKANRNLQEKLQAEIARLQLENEQLKNDLQRLKRLEIELQRRERSYR